MPFNRVLELHATINLCQGLNINRDKPHFSLEESKIYLGRPSKINHGLLTYSYCGIEA
jgi:hypothetical protein